VKVARNCRICARTDREGLEGRAMELMPDGVVVFAALIEMCLASNVSPRALTRHLRDHKTLSQLQGTKWTST
jgi:hypothetical protein